MKPLLTVNELRQLMPALSVAKASAYLPYLEAAMREFEIVTKPRRCAFLAQLAHESKQFKYMEEIWGPTAAQKRYEGRLDLGNTKPGDGFRFKGRGPIQLTGRANYRSFGRWLGIKLEEKPELAAKPEYGFRIAALFWKSKGLNEIADKLAMDGSIKEANTFAQITKRINGGTNGLADRLNYFRVAKQVLQADEDDPVGSPPSAPAAPPAVRPAESVAQEEAAEQSGLLNSAVTSDKAKNAGMKFAPRLLKHLSAGGTFVWAIIEANKIASILVLIVLAGVVVWVVYHNRQRMKPIVLRFLN